VIVIGAGVVGAACASALARAGCSVRVLYHPRRSTTQLSGGHLLLQSKRPGPSLDLARRSLELLAAFAGGREAALGYSRTGSLILALTVEELAVLRVLGTEGRREDTRR
jgi:D-hydroxyproline dehydrogenase subunit beta